MKKGNDIPSLTAEGREQQLTNLAVNLAEKKLRDGTASSQIIVHYLKLATERERLERAKTEAEVELAKAKVENLRAQAHSDEVAAKAIAAMRRYQGVDEYEEDEDIF